jgi:hypothetical protein
MVVGLISATTALLLLGLLWVQMQRGNDPALGPKIAATPPAHSPTPTSSAPVIPGGDEADEGGNDEGSGILTAPPVSSAPVAPSPAPAPVQTQTS